MSRILAMPAQSSVPRLPTHYVRDQSRPSSPEAFLWSDIDIWIYDGSNMKKKGAMSIPVRLRELRKHEEQL